MTAGAIAESPRGLQRILGLGFGLAVIIGSTIGIGILRTPGLVAGHLGASGLILTVWIAGGLYTLLGAVCLTELGTMLPAAGGYYVYARRAFGETAGFAVGWTDWLTYCAVLGYVSIGLGEFAAVLAPSLASMVTPIAITALLGFVALQWGGVRVSSRFQEVATAIKFAAFLALVLGCLASSGRAAQAPVGPCSTPAFASLIVALQSVVITYGGWQSALYFTEEDRDPQRNLPRAMIGGVAAVIVVYLLVNVALLAVLPIPDLARSTLPAADAAQIVLGGRGSQIITILSLVSLAPLLNAIMMIGTRILYAMARDGMLPAKAADGQRRRHADGRDAGHDGGGDRAHRDRHVPEAGRRRVVLPRGELFRVLPCADRAAPARAGRGPAVPRLGLSVVRGDRRRRRRRVPRRCAGRGHAQRAGRAGAARRRSGWPAGYQAKGGVRIR